MFMTIPYILKTDDDMILQSPYCIDTYLQHLENAPATILGKTGFRTGGRRCGFRARRISDAPIADHVAHVVMFPMAAGKVMHRFRL
jgi:hypothetical protein